MKDVMIVDDDEVFGELTCERLEELGYDAEFHVGPFGTMKHILKASPRVLILDVNMPALTGVALANMLDDAQLSRPISILLMSSCDENELRRFASEAKASAYLSKSADFDQLAESVAALIGGAQQQCGGA